MHALWMLLAALLFAGMGVCVKVASAWFNPAELVFYRGLVGTVVIFLVVRATGVTLRTRYAGMHAMRSTLGVVSMAGWFYSLAHIPLATAMTLNYMSSVWIAALMVGAALLAWRPQQPGMANRPPLQLPLIATVMVGFAGVVLVLKPSLGQDQTFPGLVGLLAGMISALVYMQVMALSRIGEPEARTVFYFAAGSTVAGGGAMLFTGVSPWSWGAAVWLLPIGILAAVAQLCMTRAYAMARNKRGMLVVANLQYAGIIFAALFGMVLFGDQIAGTGWLGMGLILASGIAATIMRGRAAPDAPAEEV